MNKILQKLNGKKIPISLVILAMSSGATWGVTNYKVDKHEEMLKPMPAQIAVIEQRVQNIDENFREFKEDQKKANIRQEDKMERIWQAVK